MLVSTHLQIGRVVSTHFALRLAPQRALEALVQRQARPCPNPNRPFGFCTPGNYRLCRRLQQLAGTYAYPCLRSWRAGRSDAF